MARPDSRLAGLDVLRGIAVLLVFIRHTPTTIYPSVGWDEWLLSFVYEVGWFGVELFFVLSGFLIAGLLFADVRDTGRVRLLRFYFRRGVKIWPGYYLVFACWVGAHLWSTHRAGKTAEFDYYAETVVPNVAFYQNYVEPRLLWPASWSIAVEEHFYLALPMLLTAGVALGRNWSRRRVGWAVATVGVIGMIIPLVCRVRAAGPGVLFYPIYLPTHCRFDCLLVGVLLRYLRDYAPEAFARFARVSRIAAPPLLLSAVAVAIRFPLLDGHTQIYAWTFTLNAVAFACVVAATVGPVVPSDRGRVTAALAWVGRYSYSCYLVHAVLFSLPWMTADVRPWAERLLGGKESPLFLWAYRAAFWGGSLAGGYLLAKAVEQPLLRWRDRVWPNRPPSPAG